MSTITTPGVSSALRITGKSLSIVERYPTKECPSDAQPDKVVKCRGNRDSPALQKGPRRSSSNGPDKLRQTRVRDALGGRFECGRAQALSRPHPLERRPVKSAHAFAPPTLLTRGLSFTGVGRRHVFPNDLRSMLLSALHRIRACSAAFCWSRPNACVHSGTVVQFCKDV